MRYDTPLSSPINPANPTSGSAITAPALTTRQQVVAGFKDMGRSAFSSAKNFGKIGAIYSGTECAIEGLRAKNDMYNAVGAGCLTGAGLAYQAGPQAMAVGCAGFAAFSTAIEIYLRMPADEGSRKVI
jgi:mitochondrial import inner membrane translocase subunit TIM22